MKLLRFLSLVVFALIPVSAYAQSNAEPSLHVALYPCQIFSGSLTANSTADLNIRGNCNVPEFATAVEVAIFVSSASVGSLKMWEYDISAPSASIMTYPSGTASSFGVPRLCAPAAECFYDMSARATTAVEVTLVVVGYFTPPE